MISADFLKRFYNRVCTAPCSDDSDWRQESLDHITLTKLETILFWSKSALPFAEASPWADRPRAKRGPIDSRAQRRLADWSQVSASVFLR